MIINKRYVDLNINDLSDGTYILDAHLGSGKSTLLKQLKGKKVYTLLIEINFSSRFKRDSVG